MKILFLAKVNKFELGEKIPDGGIFSPSQSHLKAHIRRDEEKNTDPDLYFLYEEIEEVGCDEDTYNEIIGRLITKVNITWYSQRFLDKLKLIKIRS